MAVIGEFEDVPAEEILEELRNREARVRGEPQAGRPRGVLASAESSILAGALREKQKVIYGVDNRVDLFQVTDAAAIADSDAVVALFQATQVVDNGDGTSTLVTQPFGTSRNLCGSEPFADQPVGAFCSGFLVEHSGRQSPPRRVRRGIPNRTPDRLVGEGLGSAQVPRGAERLGHERRGVITIVDDLCCLEKGDHRLAVGDRGGVRHLEEVDAIVDPVDDLLLFAECAREDRRLGARQNATGTSPLWLASDVCLSVPQLFEDLVGRYILELFDDRHAFPLSCEACGRDRVPDRQRRVPPRTVNGQSCSTLGGTSCLEGPIDPRGARLVQSSGN